MDALINEFIVTTLPAVVYIILATFPLWLPFLLWQLFWPVWVRYVQAKFFLAQKYVTLEVRLPKDTFKSPLAMELFLNTLHQTGGEGNWYDRFWLGKTRPWFSLELVSTEGAIHFYIWTRAGFKNFIESSLYAQFPGIEVYERTRDYALDMHFNKDTMKIWAAEFKFTKDDPYPIKTYVDYGLDKDPKEEFKVDPLAPMLEFMGTVGPQQHLWIQYIVRAHKAEKRKPGTLFGTVDAWKEVAAAEINKILIRDAKTKISGTENDKGFPKAPTITKGEQEIVAALERSLTKFAFDVGIRVLYIAEKKEAFNGNMMGGIIGSFKQFGSEHLNAFRPNSDLWMPAFSYPWQDFHEYRQNKARKEALEAYKRRSFFFPPYNEGQALVMNAEELATMFHFPGQVAATPNLARIASKKAEAPANLPR
jgi:hypothetical protein